MTQLKSAIFAENSYNRLRSNHSDSIKIEKDIETERSYEVERVIAKRIKKYERTNVTQYRIQ